MEELLLPIVGDMKEDQYPSQREYDYWNLRASRTFFIDFEIEEDYSLIELSKAIIQLNMAEKDIPKEQLEPIYLFIQSYGGDIYQSNPFCDLCISSRIPIVTVAMGAAMSAGFLIFLAGHRRYAFKHASLMAHQGGGKIGGTADQIEDAQKNYRRQLDDMKKYILERTSIDEKAFNKYKARDWYFTVEELVKYNIVDKIVEDFSDIV